MMRGLLLLCLLPSIAVADEAAAPPAPRLFLDLEIYTHARVTHRPGDDLSELRLERGEAGARIALGKQAAAELRFEAVRSAADGGALGIQGDSTVLRVKVAQVDGNTTLGNVTLGGAIGFVRETWLRALELDYTVKPLSRTGSERLALWPQSDLAAVGGAAIGPVHTTVALSNGEGLQYPERNTGKTLTGVVDVTALDTEQVRLRLLAMARDGSIGVGSLRERRVGGGFGLVTPWVRAGGELVVVRGLGDQAGAEGLLAGGWAEAQPIADWFVAARGASLGLSDDGGRQSTFGGGIAFEPWQQLRVWLAVDRVTSSGGGMALPGNDPGDATLIMVVASAIAPFTVQ